MNELRVWHNCQICELRELFYVKVDSIEEAILVINVLWDYDRYQYEKGVKSDYCNASGLEIFNTEENEWEEYYDEEGRDIIELINR